MWIGKLKIVYLGHVVSEQGVLVDVEKNRDVEAWPIPTSMKELRRFWDSPIIVGSSSRATLELQLLWLTN